MSFPNLGTYAVGATVYCPTNTKNESTQAPIILGGTPAISVYKGGSATQSTAGCAIDDDYDSVVGLAMASVDTSADGTFYAAGNDFFIEISTGTVNTISVVGQIIGMFSLVAAATASQLTDILEDTGTTIPGTITTAQADLDLLQAALVPVDTTIATLATQVSFTLTAGSADDDAYNGWIAVIQDASTAVQYATGVVKDYTGATKTVTLAADPGIFTMATTDKVRLIPPVGLIGINIGRVTGDGNATPFDVA